jgi:hypothetical protein
MLTSFLACVTNVTELPNRASEQQKAYLKQAAGDRAW